MVFMDQKLGDAFLSIINRTELLPFPPPPPPTHTTLLPEYGLSTKTKSEELK